MAFDHIPFKKETSRQTLQKLSTTLGGLGSVYSAPTALNPVHYLDLMIDARQGDKLIRLSSQAASPDEALGQIMKGIDRHCVQQGLKLVVDASSSSSVGRREFSVSGDAENGFAFRRDQAPRVAGTPPAPAQT